MPPINRNKPAVSSLLKKTSQPKVSNDQLFSSDKPKIPSQDPNTLKTTFSFKYFKQIDYFGLDRVDSKWFVSLLDRLSEFSTENITDFLSNRQKKEAYRFHPINWNQKNIPIKIHHLNWVDSAYIDNQDSYPMMQFQISKAFGRIVGFLMKIAFSILYYLTRFTISNHILCTITE